METFKVGFLGLGDIGEGMAKTLIKKGFTLTACAHRRREGIEAVKRLGGKEVANPGEVAVASNVIISVVRDVTQTNEIFFGREGMWDKLNPGTIFITGSTLLPSYCQELGDKLKVKRVDMLDAPMSGGRMGSNEGTLSFMVGGDKEVFEKCLPLFRAMGKYVFHVGDLGTGQAIKICSKIILGIQFDAVIEAMELGKKAGISKESFLEVIRTTTSNCSLIDLWDIVEPSRREYRDTGKSSDGVVEITIKDLHLAMELADGLGVHLPFTAMAYHLDMGRIRSGYETG